MLVRALKRMKSVKPAGLDETADKILTKEGEIMVKWSKKTT